MDDWLRGGNEANDARWWYCRKNVLNFRKLIGRVLKGEILCAEIKTALRLSLPFSIQSIHVRIGRLWISSSLHRKLRFLAVIATHVGINIIKYLLETRELETHNFVLIRKNEYCKHLDWIIRRNDSERKMKIWKDKQEAEKN